MATLFAASHPDRTHSLVLIGAETFERNEGGWPWGDGTPEEFEGGDGGLVEVGRRRRHRPPCAEPCGRCGMVRLVGAAPAPIRNPRTIEAHMRGLVRDRHPGDPAGHRRPDTGRPSGGRWRVHVEQGRYLAAHIPGAKYVELEGVDHLPWVDGDDILAEVEEFVTGERPVVEPDRVLATVLFSDIVGSTERAAVLGDHDWTALLGRHHDAVRRELARYRGVEIDTAGDGFLASFDGPARASAARRPFTRPSSRSGSGSVSASIPARSSGSTPASAGSPSISGRVLRASPTGARRSFRARCATSPPDPASPSRIADSTPSRASPANGGSTPRSEVGRRR